MRITDLLLPISITGESLLVPVLILPSILRVLEELEDLVMTSFSVSKNSLFSNGSIEIGVLDIDPEPLAVVLAVQLTEVSRYLAKEIFGTKTLYLKLLIPVERNVALET